MLPGKREVVSEVNPYPMTSNVAAVCLTPKHMDLASVRQRAQVPTLRDATVKHTPNRLCLWRKYCISLR